MVFSSIPAYLDPAIWQQLPNHQAAANNTHSISTQLLPPPLPPTPPAPPPPQPHGNGGGTGSIRPGSMADRARQANIPTPEAGLKCPRCESTNTKFCYFNNYSLAQPRHFCKTCKRYWTRGGSLRNLPMGGGCRKNKRSKGNISSKSLATGDQQTVAPLHHFNELTTPSSGLGAGAVSGSGGSGSCLAGGLCQETFQSKIQIDSENPRYGFILNSNILDQWRLQQGHHLPFFSGLDSSNYSSNFEGRVDPSPYVGGLIRPKIFSGATQMSSVKMEKSQEINLSRQLLGINHGNDQYWSIGSGWNDVSSFSSSSTSNPL